MKENTILHVDMDAFFASVEQARHPKWRGRPVIVGAGPQERGVVSTCSYEARAFGVHSAMPSREAYQLCPQAIFVSPDMTRYREVSRQIFEIFDRFTPIVEGVSIDEAFLDITGAIHLYGSATALAEALRTAIRSTCGVTCSVGIAPNRLLAKIGSEQHKPNGLTLMPFTPEAIATFLAPQRIRILWGIGPQTESLLARHGLHTCGDVQRLSEDQLALMLRSPAAARQLRNYSFGHDSSVVSSVAADEKSVSREETFATDESHRDVLRTRYLELVAEVGRRFRTKMRWARTARIKVRTADFSTLTRQVPFPAPVRDDISFRKKALELFDETFRETDLISKPVRLIGFGVTNIQDTLETEEISLFPSAETQRRTRNERLSATLDTLRARGLHT